MNQSKQDGSLSLHGERTHGQDVRASNVTAVVAIANILKSSLGPQGLDKMLVDDIGDVLVTNDGATILQKLEVQHPAGKVLQELSRLQDSEVGDGTTSVVLVAAELLRRANELVKGGIHPTSIIQGYRIAMKEAIKYVQSTIAVKTHTLTDSELLAVARTSLNSKFIGSEDDYFAKMIVEAIKGVKTVSPEGKPKYPVSQVNVIMNHGKSSLESTLITDGYAIGTGRAAQGMPQVIKDAKIALLDFDLRKHKLGLGVQIQISEPSELEKIRQKEMDITKDRIGKILAQGVNVVFTTQGIDDMSMKYLVDAGVYAVRRVDKKDIKRISKSTGAKLITTLTSSALDADWEQEAFDLSNIGHADEVFEERVADNDFTFIRGCKSSRTSTMLLRGANEVVLGEVERSVHDALCVVSRALENSALVPGGGAVETALAIHLEDVALGYPGREQLAIIEFAESLMTIPKILATNAALDVTNIVADLRVEHAKKNVHAGLDLINGKIVNSIENGVIEPLVSKLKSIKFATETAITILRIDDLIKLAPEPERDPRGGR
jgi:T-complex protein 1 subunit alpha